MMGLYIRPVPILDNLLLIFFCKWIINPTFACSYLMMADCITGKFISSDPRNQ